MWRTTLESPKAPLEYQPASFRRNDRVRRSGEGDYIFGHGTLPVSLTWARQGKREMATEHEGSAPEQPTTEPKEPAQDQVTRMIQELEKRMAKLSDAVVEQSTERAQVSRVFLSWSAFAPIAGAAGVRRNP